MNIRLADIDDVADIKACARAAYAMYVARIGKEPAPMVANFSAQVGAGQVYVVGEDRPVQGYVVFYPEGDHLHLENVAVLPSSKGKGFGGRLIAFVEDEARRLGLSAVELYTNEMMTENLRLYPKLGYTEQGRRREAGFDRVYFRKEV